MCLNLTSSGVIDGCGADAAWMDGAQQAGVWHVTNETGAAWGAGHQQMLRELSWPLIGDGLVLGKEPAEVGDYVSGALCESCPASNHTIQILQGLTAASKAQGRRLLYECHYNPLKDGSLMDAIAAFLVGAGEYHYFGKGQWRPFGGPAKDFPDHWVDGVFGRKLGEPAGAVYDPSTHMWSRTFASGTNVTFNAVSNKGSITWGADHDQ